MDRLRPFFSYYGAKYRLSARLPPPRYGKIVEAFAGSACYATRWPDLDVLLCDISPYVAGVWRYLIRTSSEEILRLPPTFEGSVSDVPGLCQEARWLIGFALNTGSAAPRKSLSKWGRQKFLRTPGTVLFWGAARRDLIASQVDRIRHWRVLEADYQFLSGDRATWIVDPPYQGEPGSHYPFGSADIDYDRLAIWVRRRKGLVVVHEGPDATWFPEASIAVAVKASCVAGEDRRSVERIAVFDTETQT